MRMRFVFLVAVLALLPGRAAADYAFEFFDPTANSGAGAFSSNFSVAQGSTVAVQVYLAQTGSTTGLTATGLKDGGVGLSFNQAIANVPNPAAITPNPAFQASSTSAPGNTGTASLNVFQTTSGPVFAPTTGTTAGAVLLGTFNFTGVSAGTTLTLTAEPHPAPFNNNVLGDGTVIDSIISNSSAVITVTAVPEPGSLLLAGFAAAGMGFGAWRRRQRRTAVPATV